MSTNGKGYRRPRQVPPTVAERPSSSTESNPASSSLMAMHWPTNGMNIPQTLATRASGGFSDINWRLLASIGWVPKDPKKQGVVRGRGLEPLHHCWRQDLNPNEATIQENSKLLISKGFRLNPAPHELLFPKRFPKLDFGRYTSHMGREHITCQVLGVSLRCFPKILPQPFGKAEKQALYRKGLHHGNKEQH